MKIIKNTIFKFIITLSITISTTDLLCAQQLEVISPSGNYFSNPNGSVSWTLGEGIIDTYTFPGNVLTQGLHQTQLLITIINEPADPQFDINVYPNPPSEKLIIETSYIENLSYVLYDINGKVLINEKIKDNKTLIHMNTYASAVYFLRVFKNNKEIKSFKVVKQ